MSDCILWSGSFDKDGYGRAWRDGKEWRAHRLAFVNAGGELISGMVIDHTCNVRSCVNPDHLRQVTQADNTLAKHSLTTARRNALKQQCRHGHVFDDENTRYANGKRHCRACARAASARYAARLVSK